MTQMEKLTMAVRDSLKLGDESTSQIERYLRRAVNRIQDFCNRDDLPVTLEDVAVQIVEDMLKADGALKSEQEVSSITRGDTAISYRDKTKNQSVTVDFMKDYESQLVKYKKPKLPRISS